MTGPTDSLNSSAVRLPEDSSWVDLGIKENRGERERRSSGGSGIEVIHPEDLSIENALVANFGKESKFIIGLSGTMLLDVSHIHDLINTLNEAIADSDYEKLSKIVNNIEDYESASVTDLDSENFKNFCSQHLNLNLKGERSDHQHIYSNILSMYKHNMENGNYYYSVKEVVLLAIAANDKLAEKYKDVLFAEENLSLLPLLVGGQRYIEIFIKKFPDLYQSLKEQTIETQSGQVNFFSAIALRKEQGLLNAVFFAAGGKFEDLKEILQQQQSISDSLYGIFESATLAQNMGFINIVLNSIKTDARETDDQAKKDLFKSSFITILETAISQEHVSIVEHLCTRCIEDKNPITQQLYKEALANEQIIKQIKTQVLKNIHSVDVGRKEKKQKIYNILLEAASQTGNIGFITEVLKLIENDPQLSNDQDKQAFLQDSLITI